MGGPHSISTRNCLGHASCQTPNGSSCQVWSKLLQPFPNYSGKCRNSANFGSKNSWGALTAFQLETAWVMHHARPPMVLHVKFDQNCCSRFQIIAENVENQRILGRKTHGGAPQSISTRNCFGRASYQTPQNSAEAALKMFSFLRKLLSIFFPDFRRFCIEIYFWSDSQICFPAEATNTSNLPLIFVGPAEAQLEVGQFQRSTKWNFEQSLRPPLKVVFSWKSIFIFVNVTGGARAFQPESVLVVHHARPLMVLHVKFDQNCCSRFQIIVENVEIQRILGRKTHGGPSQHFN